MLDTLWQALGKSALATVLRSSDVAYPLVSALHILGIGLLAGTIMTLDLRIVGVIKRVTIADLAPLLSRVAGFGLLLAIVTGIGLFSVQPSHYLANNAFLLKVTLVGTGLINVAIVHRSAGWKSALLGLGASLQLKLLATVSFLIWLAALVAGRWIAFV